ncbi:helix-turn-helix transcriptional regulator [Asaia siamensis]
MGSFLRAETFLCFLAMTYDAKEAGIANFPDLEDFWEASQGADRVRRAVEKGGGYNQVVLRSGISPTSLNHYLKGREMKIGTAVRLANACGVSPHWLVFGEGEACATTPVAEPARADVAMIRYYPDIQASAGYGMLGCDQPRCEEIALPMGILEDLRLPAKDAMMICVSGDSMSPTLMPHDRIIVDARMSDYLSGIYVFVSDGFVLVKRISRAPDGFVDIISDNERYPPKSVPAERFHWGKPQTSDAITIIGRVIYKMQRMS